MSLRFHEIAESSHRILNPFTEYQLMLLGDICRLNTGTLLLDLACGKAEMLCRWVEKYGINGVGVDISNVFLSAARKRAEELGVADNLTFVSGDAGEYPDEAQEFDVVSCIGATWIGSGLLGTLALMKKALKPNGLLLVGEPYWNEPAPDSAYKAMGIARDEYVSLEETLNRMESAELRLVELVSADQYGWERYEAQQWLAVDDFLLENPDDPEATELSDWVDNNRRTYFRFGRKYLGWGVFVLRSTKQS